MRAEVDMDARSGRELHDPLELAVYNGNVEIIKYLIKEYPDIYVYDDIYEAINYYYGRFVLPSKRIIGFRKILNYMDDEGKRFDPRKFRAFGLWVKILAEDYGVHVTETSKFKSHNLGAKMYIIARDANEILVEYKENPINNYKYAKDRLGRLLDMSVDKSLGLNLFWYLIELGAPTTNDKGTTFAKAIRIWDTEALGVINSDRFTNYMRDRTRAHNFVQVIIEEFVEVAESEDSEENDDDIYNS